MMKNLKRNWLVVSKLTCFKTDIRYLTNFDLRAWKVSKIYSLMGCFWPKYIMFELKKYRGAIFHDTRAWCKIWRKADLWFGKWQKFGKFSQEHTEKFSKLGLSSDHFIQNRRRMRLKLRSELCVITMKNNAKFEIESTCHFKTDMRNLTNFDQSTQKSQNSAL